MNLEVLKILKAPTNFIIMLGAGLLMFDLNYYLMTKLPGVRNQMCTLGGNFTASNIAFSIVTSIFFGIMAAAIFQLFQNRKSKFVGAGSLSGFSAFLGAMTVFCTACTLPFVSVFGLSISLTFLTDYNLAFKGVSLVLMVYGIYVLEKQLKGTCNSCKTGACPT